MVYNHDIKVIKIPFKKFFFRFMDGCFGYQHISLPTMMTETGVWTFCDFHENILMCISKDLEFRASWLDKPKLLHCPLYQTCDTGFIFAKSFFILQNNFFSWSKYHIYRYISIVWNSLTTHMTIVIEGHRGKFVDASPQISFHMLPGSASPFDWQCK